MQLTAATALKQAPCASAPRRSRAVVSVMASQQPSEAVSRRAALSALAALPALAAAAPAFAFGKDVRQAMKDKEARKQKLKESAAKMKASQKSENAFADSSYSLPEEATTPNMRGGLNDPRRQQ